VRRVEIRVALRPLPQVARAQRLAAGRGEEPMLRLVPCARRLVDPLGRELVDEQERREPRQLVEAGAERIDMMQDA